MNSFLKELPKQIHDRMNEKGIHDERIKSLNEFLKVKSENLSHGLNIKTNLEKIDYSDILKEGEKNFSYSHKNLLGKDITILNLDEFASTEKISDNQKKTIFDKISAQWNKKLDKIDLLHCALSEVRVIIFKDGLKLKDTFELGNVVSGNSYNHVIIIVGNNSDVNIMIRNNTDNKEIVKSKDGTEKIITDCTDIFIGDNSKSSIVEFRNLSLKHFVYGKKFLYLNDNAVANWVGIDKDSKIAIIKQHTVLEGANSKSTMSNILCGKDSEYFLNNISEHAEINTESMIRTKAGLRTSRAVVKGLVKINENAESSAGYQKSDILLIDEESSGVSIPDLEIHNDKVKCTHGSTISRIDEEKVFYLQSRGLSKKEAESLMIEGFYDTVLNEIPDEKIREDIRNEVVEL